MFHVWSRGAERRQLKKKKKKSLDLQGLQLLVTHTECWTENFGTLLKALKQSFFDAHDSLSLTFQYSNKTPFPVT